MYDTSLQHNFRSFAARNKIHYYGNDLSMHVIFLFVLAVFDLIVGVVMMRSIS